jgi:hypothetical protein
MFSYSKFANFKTYVLRKEQEEVDNGIDDDVDDMNELQGDDTEVLVLEEDESLFEHPSFRVKMKRVINSLWWQVTLVLIFSC